MYQGYDGQRIGIQAEWLIIFINMHQKNHPDAKYKIGNKVIYSNLDVVHKPIVCEILAVNVQTGGLIIDDVIVEKPVVEYAISNVYAQLVYEEELIVLSSNNKLACQDYCQYDSGHNCAYCDRFSNTLYYKRLGGKKHV